MLVAVNIREKDPTKTMTQANNMIIDTVTCSGSNPGVEHMPIGSPHGQEGDRIDGTAESKHRFTPANPSGIVQVQIDGPARVGRPSPCVAHERAYASNIGWDDLEEGNMCCVQ